MTSHDVCRQHRRLPRLGQWPAALAVPCPGRQGTRRSRARGEGMYGRVRAGGLAVLARPGSGKGRPLLSWLPVPGVGTGICPDGTERKAGRAWGIRQKTGMARSPARHLGAFAAQAAQTRHRRYCATVIFRGMACPRMARRRASPGLLPRWGRAPCT